MHTEQHAPRANTTRFLLTCANPTSRHDGPPKRPASLTSPPNTVISSSCAVPDIVRRQQRQRHNHSLSVYDIAGGIILHVYIVMPCLNEELELKATCASLGFGICCESGLADTILILVDNGSTDRTLEIMWQVQRSSRKGSVIVAYEAERGFVPARSHGIKRVLQLAKEASQPYSEILILQVDADTIYLPGYVTAMISGSNAAGPQTLLEGRATVPADFRKLYSDYQALSESVDASVQSLCVSETHDVVVDDKICAFRLADYLSWSGHRREYEPRGTEIYAETTRLFLKGRAFGATKTMINDAVAQPSRRKVFKSPALYFATAGFPYGTPWVASLLASNSEADTFDMTCVKNPTAVFLRQCHTVILFGVLPVWVSQAIGTIDQLGAIETQLFPLLKLLPTLTIEHLRDAPGEVITTALQLIISNRLDLEVFLLKHAI
jgi:hypothetical protein